jgi:hypothetical protein
MKVLVNGIEMFVYDVCRGEYSSQSHTMMAHPEKLTIEEVTVRCGIKTTKRGPTFNGGLVDYTPLPTWEQLQAIGFIDLDAETLYI